MEEKDFCNLIKFLRVKNEIKQDVLSKKIGISSSHLSLIERNKRTLNIKDLLSSLNFFNCKIQILKDGKDCMNMMKKELTKKDLFLTECGYCKDFKSVEGNNIKVEFDTLDGKVIVFEDMLNEGNYISMETYNKYDELYTDDEGYGEFYEKYYESSEYIKPIFNTNTNQLEANSLANKIFDNETLEIIKNTALNLF